MFALITILVIIVCILLILIVLTSYLEQETPQFIFVILGIVIFITLIPLALSLAYFLFGGYLVNIFTALAFFIASPAWLIKMMNIIFRILQYHLALLAIIERC